MNTNDEQAAEDTTTDDVVEEERAREYLLRALTASAKSEYQLARGLSDRDVDPRIAEKLLTRFVEIGLIDDAEYALTLARTRHAERGLSRRGIAVELRRKGIAEHHMQPALEQINPDDEDTAARKLVQGRLRRVSSLAPEVQYRRLAAFLGRKGYGAGLVHRVIKEEIARFNAHMAEDDVF